MAGEVLNTNQDNLPESSQGDATNFFQEIINDPQRRNIAIIAAGVLLVIVIASFTMFGSKDEQNKGELVPLVQELDQSRAFEIVAKLKSVNIEAKVDPSERPGEYIVYVYENAIETSYLALSRTNLLEDEDYGLFDSSDWAASDYDKRIKLTRAINGDLSRIISRLDGLRTAIVRVNMPEQQIFTEFQAQATATVQVELENDGDELSKSQVKSIVNVLRGYVPDLDKERISIVDTQGRSYSTFKEEDEAGSDDYIEEVERINKAIQKRIEKYLDVVVGTEKYKVSVSAQVSREKIEKQETLYSDGAVGQRQTNNEKLNAGTRDAPGPAAGSGKNYVNSSTNETLYPSFEQQNVTYLPGRVTGVTVALAVDKSIPATMSLKQLQESVAAIVGPNTEPENIKMTVVDLYSGDDEVVPVPQKKNVFVSFFTGGFWSVVAKVFSVLGILFVILVAAVIGLNIIGASSKGIDVETDPSLGDEFDEVLNDPELAAADYDDDYGEDKALQQQEALLREMMGSTDDVANENTPKAEANSFSEGNKSEMEFDNLLNNFQNVAQNQPDILAKKIQVWLDDE